MARKISPRVADRDEALRALDAAADRAAEAQARGEAGSNINAFVDATLRRLATLTAEGRLDAAVRQHLLAFDADGAARQITKRLILESPPDALFDALCREWEIWYEHGRDQGLPLNLGVAIDLSRASRAHACDAKQCVAALHSLGTALWTLGERESGTDRLEEAVAAYRAALEEGYHGSALRELAGRTGDPEAAPAALGQLREAAAVLRDGGHVPWAEAFERQIPAAEALVARLAR